jgi:small subunit ribosomal protein S16
MAVTLRLSRHGQKNRPFYRIVATETQNRRDGKFIEIVGTYNTMSEPAEAKLYEDKVKKWLSVGAQCSTVVRDLIKKNIPGLIEKREEHKKAKVQATRKARKARAAKPKKSAK